MWMLKHISIHCSYATAGKGTPPPPPPPIFNPNGSTATKVIKRKHKINYYFQPFWAPSFQTCRSSTSICNPRLDRCVKISWKSANWNKSYCQETIYICVYRRTTTEPWHNTTTKFLWSYKNKIRQEKLLLLFWMQNLC